MPLGDIAGEVLGGVFRFVAQMFVEIVVEFLIQGTGRSILRTVRPKAEPSDTACTCTGLAFWAGVIALGLFVYRQAVAA